MKVNSEIKDTLVAILNNKDDLKIATEKKWYRIPLKTRKTPLIVKENKLRYIAFYQTDVFDKNAFQIEWYAEVKNISIVKRKELFSSEIPNDKRENEYYKIEFEKLVKLPFPIISKRSRRIPFVNTSFTRLLNSREINDLFLEGPIEEKLYDQFKEKKIDSERQYMVQSDHHIYHLDFALFCRKIKIGVECYEDKNPISGEAVKQNKKKNNELTKLGWIVLRYNSEQLSNDLNEVIWEVKETINRYGGLESKFNLKNYKYYPKENDQFNLFE